MQVYKSRAGLTMHEKRLHRLTEERVRFEWGIYKLSVETERSSKGHERVFYGWGSWEG